MTEHDARRAIDRSIRRTMIVTTPFSQQSAEVLEMECDDSVDTGEIVEFWGTTEDGCEWRVHLERRTETE